MWLIPTILPGESVVLKLTVTVNADEEDGNKVSNTVVISKENDKVPEDGGETDTEETPIKKPQLIVTKTAQQDDVRPGEDLTYIINVENNGLGAAKDVEVTEYLPENASFKQATAEQGTYDEITNIWSIPSVAADTSVQLEIILTANENLEEGTLIKNTVVITKENDEERDPDLDPDGKDEEETPVKIPKLSITKTTEQVQVRAGEELTYTITVENSGLGIAKGIEITENLPSNATFVSATAEFGTYDELSHIWSIPSLVSMTSAMLTVVVKANEGLEDDSMINNAVVITKENNEKPSDLDGGDIDDSVETPVFNPNLGITKLALNDEVRPGENLTYEITVTNYGIGVAKEIVVKEQLPENATYLSYLVTSGDYNTQDQRWTIPSIQPGASECLTLTVVVSADAENGDIVKNVATIVEENGKTPDNIPPAVEKTPVKKPALSIDKQATATHIAPGETLTYTIIVKNSGLADAKNVTVKEQIPLNTTFLSASSTMGTYDETNHLWVISTLTPQDQATLTLRVTVNDTAKNGDTITNSVVVIKENDEDLPDEVTDVEVTPVKGIDLKIEKNSDVSSAGLRETIIYTIKVTNSGDGIAKNLKVHEKLPSSLTFEGAASVYGSYDVASHVWTIPIIAPKTSAVLIVRAKVNANASGDIINNAVVTLIDGKKPIDPIEDDSTVKYTIKTGKLNIKKNVVGTGANTQKAFNFTLTLTRKDGISVDGRYTVLLKTNASTSNATLIVKDGKSNFSLKHNQSLSIQGIMEGTAYSIAEANYSAENYTATSSGSSGTISTTSVASAIFTNSYTKPTTGGGGGTTNPVGNLMVSKEIGGKAAEADRDFNFNVNITLADGMPLEGTYGLDEQTTFTSGTASFTLRGGEYLSIEGIPADAMYTVTEEEANMDNYVTTVTGGSGMISEGGTAVATFLNERDIKQENTSITVVKTWQDADNKDGIRPDSVKVYLYQDKVAIDQRILSESNGWLSTFSDLPMYRADGERIIYKVVEVANQGYTFKCSYSEGVANVTNTHHVEPFRETPDKARERGSSGYALIESNNVPLGANINMNEGDCFD